MDNNPYPLNQNPNQSLNPNPNYVNPNPIYIPPALAPVGAKRSKKGFFYTILVLLLIAGAAFGTYAWQHQKIESLNSQISSLKYNQAVTVQKASATSSSSDICSLNSKPVELYCVNSSGNDIVTYSVPTLGGKSINLLVPYDKGIEYIAGTSSSSALWLLSSKLAIIKQLQFPTGLDYDSSFASWSHDGKSIFFELDGSNNSRQIYQYIIAANSYKALTTSGLNQQPYQTADGHILFLYDSGSAWVPYIMDANGSSPEALSSLLYNQPPYTAQSNSFDTYNYDAASDTVFVSNFTNSGTGSNITYATIKDLLNNVTPKVISFNDLSTCQAGSNIVRINDDTIVCSLPINPDLQAGSVVNLNNGNVPAMISPYNDPVGIITTAP